MTIMSFPDLTANPSRSNFDTSIPRDREQALSPTTMDTFPATGAVTTAMRDLLAAVSAAVVLAGCAGTPGAPLKTENLFFDGAAGGAETVADYDALVLKSDGAEIYGQILIPDRSFGAGRPCVLMFHGFAGFGRFDDVGQALCRAGCVVLIPHHRGAWGSQGKYTVSNCVQDAVNLVRHVQSPGFRKKYHIDPNAVFLVGHSMGGNTVLNAAVRAPGVRGIVMLAPCDIGTMYRQMPKDKMKYFMIDNGLGALRTDGFEAVYADLARYAAEYAFPQAAVKLKNIHLLLIIGEWDTCISNDLLKAFFVAARGNRTLLSCSRRSYRSRHGLMGVRTQVSRDIAEFILESTR